ncbi:extracellular solute-binding protein [Nakamurella aerolata]|nr:extracellular solute-binding protein [Nakamurella aerolata]
MSSHRTHTTRYRRRLTAATATVVAGAVLAACGGPSPAGPAGGNDAGGGNAAATENTGDAAGSGAAGGGDGAATTANTTSGVSEMKGTAAAGATTISFWQTKFEDYQQKWFADQIAKYNSSQNKVFVKYTVVPGDVFETKLKAAQQAGTQPDVATTNYGSISDGVAQGKFAELDGKIPAEAFADIKDNVKDFVKVGDKNYAYPMLVEPSTVLYYRADLAKAAGLDPEKPPTTWDELIDWSAKLTKGKVKGMTIASTKADLSWSSWGLQYNACGRLPISDDWSKAEATSECYTKLLQLYQTLFQKKYMPQTPKVGYPDAAPYVNGEVAMMANGSWAVGQLKDAKKPELLKNTRVAAFPSVDGDPKKPTATLGGWTLTVDSKSKNQDGAADFINWLLASDPQRMAEFFKLSGYSKFTVRTSVDKALASTPEATNDPFMKIINDQVVQFGKQEPGYPLDISNAFADAIESSMKGKADIKASLEAANAKIERTIQQQRLAGKGNG